MTTVAPYGSWRSPISSATLVERAVGLSDLVVDGETIYWIESRPAEDGRQVIVRRQPDGTIADVLPKGFSARTLVHEYGGLCFAVRDGVVWFSNFADQRLWRIRPGGSPVAISDEAPHPRSVRFADPTVTSDGRWLVCVRERHGDSDTADDVRNDIVAVAADGTGQVMVLADGHDFFAAPRISPDGRKLAWLTWDHPNMPWDGTELHVAELGENLEISGTKVVAGGTDEWVAQPRWAPDGRLLFTSDRGDGWSNLYADDGSATKLICAAGVEFSGPDWNFGQATYDFTAASSLVAAWSSGGLDRLGVVADGDAEVIDLPYTTFHAVKAVGNDVVCLAGSARDPLSVVRISLPGGAIEVLRRSRESTVDAGYISEPRPIEFPTTGGMAAHALFYPPVNPEFAGPEGERPPLVVMIHGGPTAATSSLFNARIQFFTSRGIAVVDVNYRGSTGYGRTYREQLTNQWGVADVDDCVHAGLWLAEQGEVDRDRMVIRGGSAGGYTTLAALTFRDVFAAGASHYGVADAESLALHTHKFESRYLDKLIGPYPDAVDVYRQRSPIAHTDQLSRPLILFQGLEDKVVPPEQAEMMAEALRAKGIPFAYLAFEGEQHGFRKAETIRRVYEAELWFYGRVLGFGVADEIEPVVIENE